MLRPVLVAVLVPLSGLASAMELVTPAALSTSLFDATPITTTDAKGRSSVLTFSPAGTVTRTTATGGASEGTWRLSADGFCMQVAGAKRESCYVVLKRDDGKFAAMKRAGEPFIWEK